MHVYAERLLTQASCKMGSRLSMVALDVTTATAISSYVMLYDDEKLIPGVPFRLPS